MSRKGKSSKRWEAIRKFLKENWRLIVLTAIMTVLSALLIIYYLRGGHVPVFSRTTMIILLALCLISGLVLGILLYAKKKSWKIERIFLVVGLILGAFYCFAIPFGRVPDEPSHFYRVYELSEGKLLPETLETDLEYTNPVTNDTIKFEAGEEVSFLPSELMTVANISGKDSYEEMRNKSSIMVSSDYRPYQGGAEGYVPFNYVPQVIGVWVGKILQMPLIPTFMLCRILNMVFCVLMVYLCIKYIPVMKKGVFLIGMFPMTMHLFASVSADGSIICAGMALVTYVLYARKTMKRKLKFWDFILLLLICATLTLSKPVYALLCPILFWIPKERFKSNEQKIAIIVIMGIVVAALTLLWRSQTMPSNRFGDEAASSQISLILNNPAKFLFIIFENAVPQPDFYIYSTMGSSLEIFSVALYAPYMIMLFVLFVLICAEREGKIALSLKLFILIDFILTVIAIFASMFYIWSGVNSEVIDGVQGRYFLPILLLIPLSCLPVKKAKNSELVKSDYLYVMTALVNVYGVMMIVSNHI